MRTLPEALSEVRREIGVRERCYHRWIADGKLDAVEAKDRQERMAAAAHYLNIAIAEATAAAARRVPSDEELAKEKQKGGLTGG